jgi:nicotinate dehydrogenase subunit A
MISGASILHVPVRCRHPSAKLIGTGYGDEEGSMTTINVNGVAHTVSADKDCPLLYVLRNDLEFNNPRFGCGLAQCGACTVIVDGNAIRSCITPVSSMEGKKITTLEGLGTPEHPDPVQQAFIDEQAFQCGYCLNGWVMTSKALLAANAHPTEEEITEAFSGLVCRCGSHVGIYRAVRRAAGLKEAV